MEKHKAILFFSLLCIRHSLSDSHHHESISDDDLWKVKAKDIDKKKNITSSIPAFKNV